MINVGIVVIAYNRLDSLERILKSLAMADYEKYSPTLFISIDKSDSNQVVDYARKYLWSFGDKVIIEHPKNLGLRKHVLSCGNLLNNFDGMVVLEDDITVAPSFYSYAVRAVDYYKDDDDIAGISLYSFQRNYQTGLPFIPVRDANSDVFMMNCAQSWGQVWMKKQWQEFKEWYDTHDEEFPIMDNLPESICRWPKSSWLKYHTRYCIEKDKYFVYPYMSLSTNNSDVGAHCDKKNTAFQVPFPMGKKHEWTFVETDEAICYDGFFDCKNLVRYLNKTYADVSVDFYGTKRIVHERYLLSPLKLNYKILKEWSLSLRPYELNVFLNNVGTGLFMYDTMESAINEKNSNDLVDYFWSGIDIGNAVYKMTFARFLKYAVKKILWMVKK